MSTDLHHMLAERGLEHLLSLVVEFASRFDGWRAHYSGDETLEPDHLPLSQVLAAVLTVPPLPCGPRNNCEIWRRELAFADALSAVEMTTWQAMVKHHHPAIWNPLEQSFMLFCSQPGRVETWPDTKTRWPRVVIRTWLLGRMKEYQYAEAMSVH